MRHATKIERRRGIQPNRMAHYKDTADRELLLGWLSTFVVGCMAGATLTLMVMV